jgi:hypothetical protein
MLSASASRWLAVGGTTLVVAIGVASLIPADWQQIRTGHWLAEHFLVYFAATALVCLAWPRPLRVAASLMLLAGLLEALQGLTADRVPDLPTALCGAGGVLAAAFLVLSLMRLWQWRAAPRAEADKPKARALAQDP